MSLSAAALQFFRSSSPLLMLGYLSLSVGLRVWWGGWSWADVAVLGGIALYWPWHEWVLHRTLLHMKPFRFFGRKVDLFLARAHRDHHARPWFLPNIFLPRRILLGTMLLTAAVFLLAAPDAGLAFTGMVGMAFASLGYEWTHYLTHLPYRPRSRYFTQVCLSHRLHHFKNEHYWYAFTVPLVDTLCHTGPDHRHVETSATCRTLGVDPG